MIIPAAVVKIIGFKNGNGKITDECQDDSNIVKVQLDNLNTIEVSLLPTNKSYNGTLKSFIDFKANSIIKQSEVTKAVSEIMFSENPKVIEAIKEQSTKSKDKKEAITFLAKKAIYNKRVIKKTSVIRIPIAESEKNGVYSYNSKCLHVKTNTDQSLTWGTSGVYYQAQTSNHIPIELCDAAKGYIRVKSSDLISFDQIKSLLEHSVRTIEKCLQDKKQPFLLSFDMPKDQNNPFGQVVAALYKLRTIERDAKKNNAVLPEKFYIDYINFLKTMLNILKKDKKYCAQFKATLPMVLTYDDFSKLLNTAGEHGGFSPLKTLSRSLVDLNFGNENPDIKSNAKTYIDNWLQDFENTIFRNGKVLSVLTFPAPTIFGESQSWGFIQNNIASDKFTLSYEKTKALFFEIQNYVSSLK